MEQKRVSFKVAQAIEEAGYLQWNTESADNSQLAYDCVGELWEIRYFDQNPQDYYSAPTYLDVGLWLWREKHLRIRILPASILICDDSDKGYVANIPNVYEDPEEAIIAAIEYLVDNDLIK